MAPHQSLGLLVVWHAATFIIGWQVVLENSSQLFATLQGWGWSRSQAKKEKKKEKEKKEEKSGGGGKKNRQELVVA